MAKRYTVEPGRHIHRDGKPFVSINREGDTRPVDADTVAHLLAAVLEGVNPDLTTHEKREAFRASLLRGFVLAGGG